MTTMSNNTPKQVLYLEDEEGLANLLKRKLRRQGYEVDIAPDSETGIAMLENRAYDVILVDYRLPVQSGLDVISLLAERGSAPPSIMVTGAGDERVAVEALKRGASNYVVKDHNGAYFQILPSVIDRAIEQRMIEQEALHAQEALHKSERQYRTLFEQSNDAILIIDLDGNLVDFNNRASQLLGYQRDELPDLKYDDFAISDERNLLKSDLETIVRGNNLPITERYFQTKYHHQFPVEVNMTLMNDEMEGASHVQVIARDISARKKAENALRESEERLRSTFASLDDIVLLIDPDYVLTDFSKPPQTKLANIQIEDFIGKSIDEVLPEPITLLVFYAIEKVIATNEVQQFDYQLPIRDSKMWFSVKFSKRYHVDGEYAGITIVVRDINARKSAELKLGAFSDELKAQVEKRTAQLQLTNEKLQQEIAAREIVEENMKRSLSEKEVLLKEIHHRVKNNLQVISSLLNLQVMTLEDEDLVATIADSQHRIRAMALIHEQLYQSSDLAYIDFAQYAQSLVSYLSSSYLSGTDNVILTTTIDDIHLDIDTAIPCGLIINELVTNALKHAFPDSRSGEVCVKMHQSETQGYTLTVNDNGIGLPADIDLHQTTSLGLRLVNLLTTQVGGTVQFHRDCGTTISIDLPRPNGHEGPHHA